MAATAVPPQPAHQHAPARTTAPPIEVRDGVVDVRDGAPDVQLTAPVLSVLADPDDPGARDAGDVSAVDLLLRAAGECQDEDERHRLLQQAVEAGMPAARSIALRYRDRGESVDDLLQVAYLGLVKAVHGFDLEHGTTFMAYAAPTITGEVRRWFRDRGWDVRPPRRLQDLRASMIPAVQELTQELARSPRLSEVAERLEVGVEEVVETMVALNSYTADSLDTPMDGVDGPSLGETLTEPDRYADDVEDRLAVEPLLAALPPRDRHILVLRFYRGWTQREIAEDIGVTQMQVSRLLTKALARMREQMAAG